MTASVQFRSVTKRSAEGVTVRWFGDCDVVARDILENERSLTEFARGQLVVIDLGEVTFMDSVGIHCLLALRDRVHRAGAQFVVRSWSPSVRRLMELTGLMTVLAPNGARHAEPEPSRVADKT
jgi:anti-anti-sigma factor